MNLYIARDGQALGPYSEAQLREYIRLGQFSPDDLGCPEGDDAWEPLGKLLPSQLSRIPSVPVVPARVVALPMHPVTTKPFNAAGAGYTCLGVAIAPLIILPILSLGSEKIWYPFAVIILFAAFVLAITGLVKGQVAKATGLMLAIVLGGGLAFCFGSVILPDVRDGNNHRADQMARGETPVAASESTRPRAAPTAPVRPRHLTPEGTFCLVDYVSAHTPQGVAGFEPGQSVRFVSANEAQGTLLVTDGKFQVEVRPAQLTNDLEIAALAQMQDQASQSRMQMMQEAARQADDEAHLAVNVAHANHVNSLPSGSVIGASHSRLDEPATAGSIYDEDSSSVYSDGYSSSPYAYLHRRPVVSSLQSIGGGDY